jgi:hypothetical protein
MVGAPLGPPPQALIDGAFEQGRIDYVTALRYRLYALFDPSRLPAELRGRAPAAEHPSVFQEAAAVIASGATGSDSLVALLARPGSGPVPRSRRAQATTSSAGPATNTPIPIEPDLTGCAGTWIGRARAHFKVWECTRAGVASSRQVTDMLDIAEGFWEPMTRAEPNGLGPPLSDARGGDPKIDIYLIERGSGQCVYRYNRNSECKGLSARQVAKTVPEPEPRRYNRAGRRIMTGYVLIDRADFADQTGIRTDFVHEFFHLLQGAHNEQGNRILG